ncbi:MAG TPA: VOC family protein [Gaiellaceae bacterium]
MAEGLNHVSVSASSMDESLRFYSEVFGAEPVPSPNFGFPVRWLRLGRNQLHLFERPGEAPTYHHFAVTVTTDEFAAVYRRAREHDCFERDTFRHHFYELPGDCAQLYLRDPGGNLVEVDVLGASGIADEVRSDMKRLADAQPQSEENLRATLFLDR